MTDSGKKIKLTIGIPIWNGSRTIKTTLDSIVGQLEPGVEIVISDNASTDDTAKIVQDYQRRFPQIRYFKNNDNLGFDKNVDSVVRRASGEFVWLFADDDFMHENAISHVLCSIETHPAIAVIFVDSYKRYTHLKADYVCSKGDEFFAITKFRAGGLSANVVNKAIWERTDLTGYIGSGWIHVGFLIVALSQYQSLICRDSFKSELKNVAKRWGHDGSFFMVGINAVRVFRTMERYAYSKRIMREAVATIKKNYWRAIPSAKAKGLKVDKHLIGECIELYKGFPTFWLVDMPLFFVPNAIFRFLWKLYAFCRRY